MVELHEFMFSPTIDSMESIIANIIEFIMREAGSLLTIGIFVTMLFVWGKLSEKEWYYRWITKIRPKSSRAHINLGNFLSRQNGNKKDEAALEFRQAINLDPFSQDAYHGLFLIQDEMKRDKEAEETINHLIELFPQDPLGYIWKGELHAKNNELEEAEDQFRKAIALAPRLLFAYEHYGYFLLTQNRFGDAEKIFLTAVNIGTNSPGTYQNLVNTLIKQGKLADALNHAQHLLKIDPTNQQAAQMLGYILNEQGNTTEAEKFFRQAILQNPGNSIAYNAYGTLLSNYQGRALEAEEAFRKAIDLNPSDSSSHSNLGALLISLGRYKEAEESLRKAIILSPDNAVFYYNLGIVLKNLKQYDEAIIAYRKTIELNESNIKARQNLIDLFRETGNAREAIPYIQKIIEINPEDFTSYLCFASVKKGLGEFFEPSLITKARQLVSEADSYNMACIESICDNHDTSFEHLQKASKKEGFDPTWAWEDPDLQWIRDDPRFIEIVGPKPDKGT